MTDKREAWKNQDPDQLFQLGMAYARGNGVPQNNEKAVDYLLKAAYLNHREALICCGEAYYLGLGAQKSRSSARTLIYGFAKDTEHWLWLERYIGYDESKSFEDYLIAANNGDDAAQTYLMHVFDFRMRLTAHDQSCNYWAEKLVAKGDLDALFVLAGAYINGRGVAIDYTKARELLNEALRIDPNGAANMVLASLPDC